jgi:hypothetical protein
MAVKEIKAGGIWILLLLCPLAAAANKALGMLVQEGFRLPLFLDTLFNAAITFSAGLLPGIATALLTYTINAFFYDTPETLFFVFCGIAEVILVWIFHRRFEKLWTPSRASPAPVPYSFIAAVSSLLILALIACAVISILGGIIDTALFIIFSQTRVDFSPEGTFRLGLLRNGIPLLWANILSRFPVNLVDRFIVVFGGYGISLLIGKIYPRRPAPPAF